MTSNTLAQSLLELLGKGIDRADVDTIILEAQFGLGASLKMPDMAASIVSTAQQLYPNGPHAAVFFKHFSSMNILTNPLVVKSPVIMHAGSDRIVEPGETVRFKIPLRNKGVTPLSEVSGHISTTDSSINIIKADREYPDLLTNIDTRSRWPYKLEVPVNHICGQDIPLTLETSYTSNSAAASDISLLRIPVGQKQNSRQESTPNASIPDNTPTGVVDEISISDVANSSQLSIDVNISHTYSGDIKLILTSPSGTAIILRNPSSESSDNIIGNFPNDFTPYESLSVFDGEDLNGTWSLTAKDTASQDIGTLNNWAINTSSVTCPINQNSAPEAHVNNENVTIEEGKIVYLDASSSIDPDGDQLTFKWEQTSGPAVSINNADQAQANFTTPEVDADAELTFNVIVTDPSGESDTKTVIVRVTDVIQSDIDATISRIGVGSEYNYYRLSSNIEANTQVSWQVLNPTNDGYPYIYSANSATSQMLVPANVSGTFEIQVTVTLNGVTSTKILPLTIQAQGEIDAAVVNKEYSDDQVHYLVEGIVKDTSNNTSVKWKLKEAVAGVNIESTTVNSLSTWIYVDRSITEPVIVEFVAIINGNEVTYPVTLSY